MSEPAASDFAVSRRRFIQAATTAAVALAAKSSSVRAAEKKPAGLIDTNVSLGQWPFRREVLDSTPALVAKLRAHGVTQAWAGSFEALLHRDVSSVNARLAEECRRHGDGLLVPMGALNPMLPGWEEDLRRCAETHQMPGLRLHPNYHGYTLENPAFERVLELARERKLLVQISVIMEEARTIHPLVAVPATETAPLASAVAKFPGVRVQLLNAFRTLKGLPAQSLAERGVGFEIAMLEGVNGVANLLTRFPAERLCFGSHAPFFYFESAKLKLQESVLDEAQRRAVCFENARRLLAQK